MHASITKPLADQAGQRSQGYWLLSKLFLELPTPDRLQALKTVLASLKEEKSALQEAVTSLFQAVEQSLLTPEETAVDYTRRLVVVSKDSQEPLPFEAHVREKRLPGDATEAIQVLMTEFGYANVAPDASSPDHIGVELRLMAMLCHDECQAWQTGELNNAVSSLRRQNILLHTHLVKWVPDYCQTLAERSSDAYIQAIARLTRQALVDDSEVLAEISGHVDSLLSASVE